MNPSDDEIKELICQAEDRIMEHNASIFEERILIASLKELLQRRGWDSTPISSVDLDRRKEETQ